MKKHFRKILLVIITLVTMVSLCSTLVHAQTDEGEDEDKAINPYSSLFFLSNGTNSSHNELFTMPDNGSILLNLSVMDQGSIPGTLTLTIKDRNTDGKTLTQTFSLTSNQGIVNKEIPLDAGNYLFSYVLSNGTGDLSKTSLKVSLKIDFKIVSKKMIPKNVSALTPRVVKKLKDVKAINDTINFGGDVQALVLPFTIQEKGAVIITIREKNQIYDNLKTSIYEDEQCTTPLGKSFTLVDDEDTESASSDGIVLDSGTYYVKFSLEGDYDDITSFDVTLDLISVEERTLTNKSIDVAYQNKNSDKMIYKIIIRKNSVISLFLTPNDDNLNHTAHVQLLDENKNALTNNSYIKMQEFDDGDQMQQYYTLKPGTYYTQVDTTCGEYIIECGIDPMKNQAGNSKKHATVLKIGGPSKLGCILLSDKVTSTGWFKFTAPRDLNIEMDANYLLNGNMEIEITDSRGKVIFKKNKFYSEGGYTTYFRKGFKKGTYYIKISKTTKPSSLSYGICLIYI